MSKSRSECLNAALRLQHRSVLTTRSSGSVIGLEYQAHADKMREHSLSELEDATRLVEKIAALGGEPTTEVAPLEFVTDPAEALDRLIDAEGEDARGAAGCNRADREAASEAVEHRLEHMIMQKQEQVDHPATARRRP